MQYLVARSDGLDFSFRVSCRAVLDAAWRFSLAGFDYGSNGGVAEFPATGCVVVVAHRQVNCSTTAGAGSDVSWVLTIGNQTSQSPVTSYATPAITSVRMQLVLSNGSLVSPADPVASLSQLSTEGGEVISISGANLGPAMPRSYISAVWYGLTSFLHICEPTVAFCCVDCYLCHAGSVSTLCWSRYGAGTAKYDLSNCTFTVPHSQIQCITVPGVGFGHLAQVRCVSLAASSLSLHTSLHFRSIVR